MKVTVNLKCPSLNQVYAGKHWTYRTNLKLEWARELLPICHEIEPFKDFPLTLDVKTYFKTNRRRDCDNTVMGAKIFLDCLVAHGLLPDDSPKYVNKVVLNAPQKAKVDKVVFELFKLP